MDATQPHRCLKCGALVVDRRSPTCTTCHTALPADWVMSPEQAKKMMELDRQARALHQQEMITLDPLNDPNLPPLLRFLDSDPRGPNYP